MIELRDHATSYSAFSIDSLEDLGPELLVAWDRDLIEELPHPEHEPRLSLHVVRDPRFRPYGLFIFNHGTFAAIYSYKLQRWFPRLVDMLATEDDVIAAEDAT